MDQLNRQRRQKRIRMKIHGTATRPRAVVNRSLRQISVQIVDDGQGKTLLAVWSGNLKGVKGKTKSGQAELVGQTVARLVKEKGIKQVVFDRAGYRYHGRVKAVAEAMRAGGLEF